MAEASGTGSPKELVSNASLPPRIPFIRAHAAHISNSGSLPEHVPVGFSRFEAHLFLAWLDLLPFKATCSPSSLLYSRDGNARREPKHTDRDNTTCLRQHHDRLRFMGVTAAIYVSATTVRYFWIKAAPSRVPDIGLGVFELHLGVVGENALRLGLAITAIIYRVEVFYATSVRSIYHRTTTEPYLYDTHDCV